MGTDSDYLALLAALAKRILHKHGLDDVRGFIVALYATCTTSLMCTNEEEAKRTDACSNKLLDGFEKEGYAVYRVNTRFQERVAQSYGPVERDVEHANKRVLDPTPFPGS
ncbi:MAG TPA: hypothetical protein VFC95_03170 [Guyparkeria sp.]|nr:hypothetical protein [Guyparkeria sp.]